VQVLLTPECALTGYPPALGHWQHGPPDWCQVGDLEDDLLTAARHAGLTLVLGTSSPGPDGISNDALAGPDPAPVRYRKRHLTEADTLCFAAGRQPGWIDAHGWRLGLGICYDLRFDDVWADLARADCDAFLCIAHMAGPDCDPGVKAAVVPQVIATRAMGWATPLAFCSTTAADNWVSSGLWDARGVATHRADASGEHLLAGRLQPRSAFDPWYDGLRRAALGGD
jgi:predicted amidohydrolase